MFMKKTIDRTEAKRIEELLTQPPLEIKAEIKLLVWREVVTVVREPEPPRFIERSPDVGHWGINE
jgi:hypothetical protein